jgi:2-keto-4-pentenoate hydratase
MALTRDDSAAFRLQPVEKTRTQIRQLSRDHPAIIIDDAYAIA